MKLISTYRIKIKGLNRALKGTLRIYRDAVGFYIRAALGHWDSLSSLGYPNDCIAIMETLTHGTKQHPVPEVGYNFDEGFPQFPSYLRRAAIKEAVGKVSSYMSNLKNWEASGRKGNLYDLHLKTARLSIDTDGNARIVLG